MLISLTSGLYVVGNILYMPVYKDFLYKNFQWPDRCQKRFFLFLFSKSPYAAFLCRQVYVMLIFNPKKNPPWDSKVIYLWISNIIYLPNTIDTHSVGSTQKEIPNFEPRKNSNTFKLEPELSLLGALRLAY